MPLLTRYLTLLMAFLRISLIIIHQKGLSVNQFQPNSNLKKTPDSIHASSPDTIIYDTVIIVKEPIIIRKEIFISDTTAPIHLNLSAGLNAGMYRNYFIFSKSSQTINYYSLWKNSHTNKNSYSLNGNFHIAYKGFGFRTGLSFIRYNEDFNYSYFKYLFDTSTVIVTDTIDEYFVVQSADTIWHYVTQTTQKEVIDSARQDYTFE
ncbi:MAG: hypothetical protein HY738_19405, partial [Bacteroidia bacterium]|nr:hypothetical protein [Bacteroidia bacterium]